MWSDLDSITVRSASPADREAWDAYVRTQARAHPYQLYDWNQVFREAFGCETCYLLGEVDKRIVGVLPLFMVRRSLLGGKWISSMPGGVLADHGAVAQRLIEASIELTQARGACYLSLRDSVVKHHDGRFQTRTAHSYTLSVESSPVAAWASMPSKFRQRVRKARRDGLTAMWDNANISGFYHAYAARMHDFGTPALPKRFFAQSLVCFPEHARLLIIHFGDRAIASGFLFGLEGTLYFLIGAALHQFFGLPAMELALWEVIEHACEAGFHTIDLGRSVPGSGQARWKEKYLARSQEFYYQFFMKDGGTAPELRGGKLYRWGSILWRHLPLPVANILSPVVRRRIPLG